VKFSLDAIPVRDIVPGFHGRFVHSDNMTFAYFNIDEGTSNSNWSWKGSPTGCSPAPSIQYAATPPIRRAP
jgi:hypothetical protein